MATQAYNALARRILRTCRGNLEDVNRGAIFEQFMAQHNIWDVDFEPTRSERMRVQSSDYQWMNELLGGNYASSMVEAPLYRPPSGRLSRDGVWEHGESSSAATARTSSSQPVNEDPISQVIDPTQHVQMPTAVVPEPRTVQRPRRVIRPPEPYTPTQYLEHLRRARRRGRGRGGGDELGDE